MYRRGHNENDSKSFWRDERHVGSNPTISAKNKAHKRFSVCELFLCPNGNGEFSPKNRLFSPKKYHYSNSISMYSAYPLYLIRLFLSANCIQSSA